MRIDASIHPSSLEEVPKLAQQAEEIGFDGLWTSETQHNPFLPLSLVAEHTQTMQFGTSVAIGFARSPTDLATIAWDLSRASQGRFILGLGTQVRAHIERRFGGEWPDSPISKLRELIMAIRSLWKTWQHDEQLNFRGQYYKLTLMSPFFNPGPIDHPDIPIHIAGVNRGLCRLAGEIAEGFHVHPLHTQQYLHNIILPSIEEGRKIAGKPMEQCSVCASIFVVQDETEAHFVRSQIAFYASTPTYRNVLSLHGWEDIGVKLSNLARKKAWTEMPELVTDEMMAAIAVHATADDVSRMLQKRYDGLVDRIKLYRPFVPGERDEDWRNLCLGFQEA